ncbi:hypothetical protein LMG667_04730 [Xanthomonas euvesicatoria]|nr:hypothetical protein LMG667_04730 [Xanthomonas euvesicatoria]
MTAMDVERSGLLDEQAEPYSSHSLWEEACAMHDRDHQGERDGVPAHKAGALPQQCDACALFAALSGHSYAA